MRCRTQVFLQNRLLNGLCESEHSEKSMIAKLKTECGYELLCFDLLLCIACSCDPHCDCECVLV